MWNIRLISVLHWTQTKIPIRQTDRGSPTAPLSTSPSSDAGRSKYTVVCSHTLFVEKWARPQSWKQLRGLITQRGSNLQAAQVSMCQDNSLSLSLVLHCFPTMPGAIKCCVSTPGHSAALTASWHALSCCRLRAQPSCCLRNHELENHMENNGYVSEPQLTKSNSSEIHEESHRSLMGQTSLSL